MAGAGVDEDLEVLQFLGGLHALVAELHDVDAAGQDRVEELREVALALAGVRAEVDAGVGELGAGGAGGVGHGRSPGVGGVRAVDECGRPWRAVVNHRWVGAGHAGRSWT